MAKVHMKKFAVFDIDGTLIRWQLYHAVVDRLAKRELLGSGASESLREARMKWKRREHSEAFKEYEKALITIYESALKQLPVSEFDEAVHDIAKEYKEQTYTYTRDLIAELKSKDYFLLAISGSQTEIVEQIAQMYGFDDFVGTIYERSSGAFTGKSFIASLNKRQVLEALIKKHGLRTEGSIAVGDSLSDVAMLEMVERPIAFNPDTQLFSEAKVRHWPIIIERKNVIYHLEYRNGSYVLA